MNPQSVANWVNRAGARAAAALIPHPPADDDTVVEPDKLFAFVGSEGPRLPHHAGRALGTLHDALAGSPIARHRSVAGDNEPSTAGMSALHGRLQQVCRFEQPWQVASGCARQVADRCG